MTTIEDRVIDLARARHAVHSAREARHPQPLPLPEPVQREPWRAPTGTSERTGVLANARRKGPYALSYANRCALHHAARGLTNAAIGRLLDGTSEDTIKSRMRVVYAALDVNERTCAVAEGLRLGIIPRPPVHGECPWNLANREVQVLQGLADHGTNHAVADVLGISHLTVKSHLARIARKAGTGSRERLVAFALAYGIIQ